MTNFLVTELNSATTLQIHMLHVRFFTAVVFFLV